MEAVSRDRHGNDHYQGWTVRNVEMGGLVRERLINYSGLSAQIAEKHIYCVCEKEDEAIIKTG